ncbi:hypothetical protein DFH29DRAFT_1003427 [Suillus ampliporus]|nr:hypothetical protein DFH29DRAFT_1003427 [Suillus ampliporus]
MSPDPGRARLATLSGWERVAPDPERAADYNRARVAADRDRAKVAADTGRAGVAADMGRARVAADHERAGMAVDQARVELAADKERAGLATDSPWSSMAVDSCGICLGGNGRLLKYTESNQRMYNPRIAFTVRFQIIQEFKSLPDFLMFPAFLALKPQDHFTSTFPLDTLLPDTEIVHTMTVFAIFTNEARERSQSASNTLNYACQNWVFHLSWAPNAWDDRFNHAFKLFWDHHPLSWLERQWCLKGLRSCLVVLSEGQKLTNVCFRNSAPDLRI